MGAKFWFAVYSDGDAREHLKVAPQADPAASAALAAQRFPGRPPEHVAQVTMFQSNPTGREVLVGVYPGVTIVAAEELAIDYPSRVAARFVEHGTSGRMTVHLQHSVVDWSAFALWEDGVLKRSLSVSADNGIIEDIGDRLPFEREFWNPEEPYDPEGDPIHGHPLDLGEEALLHFLGFQFEGMPAKWLVDPENLAIPKFRVGTKPFWKIW